MLTLPLMFGVGLVVDFDRASNARASLQSFLDAALLAGVSVIGNGDQKPTVRGVSSNCQYHCPGSRLRSMSA
jgi:hypothetical protein